MKRITSLFLALLLCLTLAPTIALPTAEAASDVAINATNFPDETFRSYVSDNFDTDGNGKLSTSEIADVTGFNVYGRNISSLKGVEYFTALTWLDCQFNQLTSLDVSKNTVMETLYCGYNQLASLDVSKNTALDELRCGYNQLTTLNVKKNTALWILRCGGNQLTSLDVSKNTALVSLSCSSNQLTELDVSKNSALMSLSCHNNQLTELNISKCPNLIDIYAYITKKEYEIDGTVVWEWNRSDINLYLCVDSTTTVVTATSKPAISNQPADKSAKVGDSVKFTVAATGGELTYRWQYRTSSTGSWKNSGATGYNTPTLTISAATSRNGYQYRCVVENEKGKAISKAATLTVKPKITTQPTDKSGYVGGTVKFTVAAKGDGLTYRWQYYNGSAWKNSGLTGHDTATLSVGVTAARNGQQYRCVVTDKNGNKTISSTAKLIVKPKITTQPANKTASTGTTVKFTVKATGAGLTYRWQYRTSSTGSWKNSTLTGHDTATLTVSATAARNGYQYRCVIVDEGGTKLISSAATLTVSSGSSSGTGTVYWAETGTKYHTHKDCRSLSNSDIIYSGTVDEAIAAGRPELCKICSGR